VGLLAADITSDSTPEATGGPLIRVVVIDDAPRTVENLSKLLSFEADIEVVGTALNARGGLEVVRQSEPDVLLMDVNLPDMDGIRVTEQMASDMPLVPVILMSVQEDREYLRRAMQAGARQYLVKPFSADELVAAVRQVYQMENLKRATVARTGSVPIVPDPASEASGRGTVAIVFSGKGGVGKSTIAVNLAADLAQVTGQDVALVDLDLQFGDVAVLLGLEPVGTMSDVARAFPNIDGPFLGELMPEAAGVRILAAPLSPELADLVSPACARATLDILASAFDYVVVDMAQHLNDVTLEAMDVSDRIYLVTDLNLPAIKDAKLAFRLFDTLGISREKVALVVNRSDAPADHTVAQLEANLRFPASARIPSAGKIVLRSIQKATPFVILDPEAEISLKIRELTGTLVPLGSQNREGPRRSLLRRRLFSRSTGS
jgi:pilus assembly protein CpaE